MMLFDKKGVDPVAQEMLDEIRKLSIEVSRLRGEKDAIDERRTLLDEREALRADIETLKLEKDRRDEEFARKMRDVEHATGLHRKQSDWERDKAVEEAKLAVREENLSTERQRFEDQIKFHKEQIAAEVDRLERLLTGLMERLPTVTVEKSIDLSMAGNGART